MGAKDTRDSGSGVQIVRPRSEGRTAVEVGAGLLIAAAQGLQKAAKALRRPTPWGIAFALVVLGAAVLRFWDLGSRAFHHDEGIHAYYTWLLAAHGIFRHDPLMHGPFQFIATAGLFKIFGDSDTTARLLPAILGTAAVAAPLLLRPYLGRLGALATAALLAVSPAMLYFSRFFRNDADVVLWSLLLVWAIFRYLDTRRHRYLYASVTVLALSFATKEITYIHLLTFGSFLAILALPDLWGLVRRRTSLSRIGPAASLLLLVATLALPLGAAGLGLFQGPLGLTLVNDNPCRTREYIPPCPDGQYVALGVPLSEKAGIVESLSGPDVAEFTYLHTPGAGELNVGGVALQSLDVAVGFTLFLFGVGAIVGLLWNRRVWIIAALLFWGLFVVLFTTIFTNWIGVGTGIWQSLGYWLAQQEERRGGQPWYYYTLVLSTYEF
ncbi:MAG: TIGR03663 family protein, partial [Chloroflexi bacterium]|nr:TIGR03663 family protein [Chloroflexota bacterium]